MSWIDWGIMILAVVILRLVSLSTKKYMKGVADFLAANRCAGRYLLTIAGTMGITGTIVLVGQWEAYKVSGWVLNWWGLMGIMIPPIVILTGFVIYRYRETRALTLAQFVEMRYSRGVRIYAGILCFVSGVINFGIFPATAARFFVYFCGLPPEIGIPGTGLAMPTFIPVMIVDLALALTFVTMGGQVSVMVTECFQGIVSGFIFIIVTIAAMVLVKWPQMIEAMNIAARDSAIAAGQPASAGMTNFSMYNPFHAGSVPDFNLLFIVIGIFVGLYATMNWQGNQAFNCSGRTPHEQKMGAIISAFRGIPQTLMSLMVCFAAIALLKLPEYAPQAAEVNASLGRIANEAVRNQMVVPIALSHILPVGIKGLFVTVMLFFSFTMHDTFMHSWGSIFVQDIYLPTTRKQLSPDQHIKLLRWAIMGVAAFAVVFGALYPQNQPIFFFWAVTGAIWTAGSGAVIIGGLYWRKGTSAAAYTVLTLGMILGLGYTAFLPQCLGVLKTITGRDLNGQYLQLAAILIAIIAYVVVSLATSGKSLFNLDRMLHRGQYADGHSPCPEPFGKRWHDFVGITSDFSFGDKLIVIGLLVWNIAWFAVFVVITAMNLKQPFPDEWWAGFWHVYLWVQLGVGVPTTIWITVGGFIDIKDLFRTLASAVRDHTDDGRVVTKPELKPEAEMDGGGLSGKKVPSDKAV